MLNFLKQSLGGRARANKLSPQRRAEIAKQAATKRWQKHGPKPKHAEPESDRQHPQAQQARPAVPKSIPVSKSQMQQQAWWGEGPGDVAKFLRWHSPYQRRAGYRVWLD